MKTQTKSNLIASIVLALVPIGLFALLLPAGDVVAGVAITAALIGIGVMDLRQEAYTSFRRSSPKRRPSRGFRLSKSRAHS